MLNTGTNSGEEVFFEGFCEAATPKQNLPMSIWADRTRWLSSKGSARPGRWNTDLTPHLREIMDVLSDNSPVRKVVIKKPAQSGGTEVGLNWIGYVIDHAPAPMLVVLPTLEVRERWVKQRLQPLITETPAIAGKIKSNSRDSSNSQSIKDFEGGMLILGGANSAASLSSMPIKYTMLDEVDRFPWDVGGEGDPIGLIDQRQATFSRRKMLLISTPTIAGASRIDEEFLDSDQRYRYVTCPHCHESQILEFKQLQWDKAKQRAWIVCSENACIIEEHEKPAMLANARWIAHNPGHATAGFFWNALCNPIGLGYSWWEIVDLWLKAQSDKAKLKRFINTVLAEVWEDKTRDVRPHVLKERAEPYPLRTVPPGCLMLTAGIDTQDDRLEIQIIGWGQAEKIWTIDYIVLPGDPSRETLWIKLSELLNSPLRNAYGRDLYIQGAAIDSGGHHTHAVYNYVRSRGAKRLMAIKGAKHYGKAILHARPSKQDVNWRGKVEKKGVDLWTVGTDTAKHWLMQRLVGDTDVAPEDRKHHFSEQLPDTYYDGLTAEYYDPEKNRWVRRRSRANEPLDTMVYAIAAGHHPELRAHRKKAVDWAALAAQLEPATALATSESSGEAPPEAPHALVAPVAPAAPKKKATPRKSGFVKNWG